MDESASREEEKAWRESFVGLRVALPDYQGGGQGVIKAVVGQVVHVVVGDDNKGWKRDAEFILTSHLDELEEADEPALAPAPKKPAAKKRKAAEPEAPAPKKTAAEEEE